MQSILAWMECMTNYLLVVPISATLFESGEVELDLASPDNRAMETTSYIQCHAWLTLGIATNEHENQKQRALIQMKIRPASNDPRNKINHEMPIQAPTVLTYHEL
jgi:hypothetical protein